jgi:hypothetical protein
MAEMKKIGLDGFCLTEHQVLWDFEAIQELAGGSGLKIFRGNEITTAQGIKTRSNQNSWFNLLK